MSRFLNNAQHFYKNEFVHINKAPKIKKKIINSYNIPVMDICLDLILLLLHNHQLDILVCFSFRLLIDAAIFQLEEQCKLFVLDQYVHHRQKQ